MKVPSGVFIAHAHFRAKPAPPARTDLLGDNTFAY
jgi:hypothetical protein